jgi:small-conductance mechanosensitive channel
MNEIAKNITGWVNTPIFYLGQHPVTLGGIGFAIFIFLGALIVSAIVQRLLSSRLSRKFKLTPGMTYAFQRIIHYIIIVLALLVATQLIGIDLGSLAVIFGFLGVGIGFGLQNLTSNFIAGLILLIERPIEVGDFISIENQVGKVTQVNMRVTLINTIDNIALIVPNAKFVENQIINWSHGNTRVRIHCPVGVAYGSDIAKVKATLLKVAADHPDILTSPAPEVRFLEFGNSSLDFDLLVWTDNPEKQFLLHSQINYAIDRAFRDAEITIPFPQSDLYVKLTPAIEKLAGR